MIFMDGKCKILITYRKKKKNEANICVFVLLEDEVTNLLFQYEQNVR